MLIDPRADLKLFVEGYSCSIMSASISTAVKLTAAVEVLPTKQVRRIKPMTNIVIGFRDISGSSPVLTDDDGTTYSVLFVGMVTGIALTKTGTSRSASLSCSGHQTLLERHYTYISNIPTQNFSQKQNFLGASSFFRSEQGRGGLAEQVATVFKDESPPYTPGLSDLSGPPKGAIKLIEKCIGVTLPSGSTKEGKVHGAQHEFFAHASHQCRLLFQIDGVSVDEGLNQLIDNDKTGAAISNASSQMSDITDLATMLDILLGHMYYTFSPMGAPRTYISSDKEITQRSNVLSDLTQKYVPDVIVAGAAPKAISAGGSVLVDFAAGAEISYGDLPDGANKDEVAKKKFTDFIKTPDGMQKVLPGLSAEINNLVPTDRRSSLMERIAPFVFDGVRFYPRSSTTVALINEQDAIALNQLTAFLLRSIALSARIDRTAMGTSFARVVSYNMIPDLSFCTPPTCNVIFPNQISTFNYNKNTFSMPTRLLLYGTTIPMGKEQQGGVQGYYAPSTSAFEKQGAIAKEKIDIPLLNHEKFTGIVPSFASISFFEKFKSVDLSDESMMLRIANFNLMIKRYETTTITCTGPFNPFVAVGFPIAFIDVDDINAENPSLYVGMLASCSHSYTGAGSASTTYTVKAVREVGEVDEIFGDAVLRATNSSSPNGVTLSFTESDLGSNFISRALVTALQSISNMPAFLAAYDLRPNVELMINGVKKSFRGVFTRKSVFDILEKNLPAELVGRQVVAVEWVGTSVATPLAVLTKLTSSIENAQDIVDHVEKEPIVNNMAYCARAIVDSLDKYFENFETKADLVKVLTNIGSDKIFDAKFSVALLNEVRLGRSLFQILVQGVELRIVNGLHQTNAVARLKGVNTVTPFSLLPLDISRIVEDANAKRAMSYFGSNIEFPSNSVEEVSVFLYNPSTNNLDAAPSEKIAVEELYRPPWFSDIFSIGSI